MSEVSWENQKEVKERLYGAEQPKPRESSLKVGDYVRMLKEKKTFGKGYEPQWTEEVFQVAAVLSSQPVVLYRVRDLNGAPIKGSFYKEELQKVVVTSDTEYRIEKILKRRKKGRQEEVFIKWKGYPDSFNSWINAKDVVDLRKAR